MLLDICWWIYSRFYPNHGMSCRVWWGQKSHSHNYSGAPLLQEGNDHKKNHWNCFKMTFTPYHSPCWSWLFFIGWTTPFPPQKAMFHLFQSYTVTSIFVGHHWDTWQKESFSWHVIMCHESNFNALTGLHPGRFSAAFLGQFVPFGVVHHGPQSLCISECVILLLFFWGWGERLFWWRGIKVEVFKVCHATICFFYELIVEVKKL